MFCTREQGERGEVLSTQSLQYGTSTTSTGGTYESLLLSQYSYSISISNGIILLISLHITVYKMIFRSVGTWAPSRVFSVGGVIGNLKLRRRRKFEKIDYNELLKQQLYKLM